MGYPRLANWTGIRKSEDGQLFIKDFVCGEEYSLSASEARFLKKLDGKTDPYSIETDMSREDVEEFLDAVDFLGLTRKDRFISKSIINVIYTLWIPVITRKHRIFAKFANAILKVIWLPMLVFSLILSADSETDMSIFGMLSGSVVGMLVGIILHETGHMFACLAYGGRIFEVGVLLRFFMPGAYVMLDTSDIKVRMKRIQINAAGIEMNFLLTAIFGIIACCSFETSSFFAAAAGNNLLLGLLNLTFINGLDGMNIIGEILGIENFVARALKTLFNSKYRKRLVKKGISGKATATACFFICLAQIALPVIFIINIVGVFQW